MRARKGAYRSLVGKPEGRRPIGKSKCRRENNSKMNLREIGWGHELDGFGSG
jgi:hypothetical protein